MSRPTIHRPAAHALGLLILSLYILLLFMASGHRLNFHDTAMMTMLVEALIFFLTACLLFFVRHALVQLIALILTQAGLTEFGIEISSIGFDNAFSFVFVSFVMLLFLNNAWLIYSRIKLIRTV